ncbi:MAG: 7-cyano-7-deazaguanine synthase QueC [Planctomycetota bacterium]|jgi:7-cyano-7-deazaguanine synthase
MAAKTVVLLSGGVDSTTTLAIARNEGFNCHALSFDYGQRQRCELDAARAVAKAFGAREHRVATIDLRAFGGSALTDDLEVPKDRPPDEIPAGIPITYVPARNTIFLSFALGWAEVLGAADIFIGVNAVDYSGYPDCRPQYIAAFEAMANLATRMGVEGNRITIHTPLIELTKAGIIKRGLELGVDYGLTFSCYDPDPGTGRPCGRCDACLLRARGFAETGLPDPALGGS